MLKTFLAALSMLCAVAAFAAVDVNKATTADLDGIKGIGPVMSKRIMTERRKSEFKNWDDFVARVKGIGQNTATSLSAEGLTVNGQAYKPAAAAAPTAAPATAAAPTTPATRPTPATPAASAKK